MTLAKLATLGINPILNEHLACDGSNTFDSTAWTPTFGTDSGWTTSAVTATTHYWQFTKLILALIDVTLTLTSDGGVAPSNITFTLPSALTPVAASHITPCLLRFGGVNKAGNIVVSNTGGNIQTLDGTKWAAGASNGVFRSLAWWEAA